MAGADRPWRHMVLQDSLRHTAGIDSCMQHSTGWSNTGDHMGSCRLVVVADDRVGVEHLERLLVAGFEQWDWEWSGRYFDPRLLSHNEIESVGRRSEGTERSFRLVVHCIRYRIFAEMQNLLGPALLAAIHIADYNNYYTHCAVEDLPCSRKKIRLALKRRHRTVVVVVIVFVGLDIHRMGFGWRVPVG